MSLRFCHPPFPSPLPPSYDASHSPLLFLLPLSTLLLLSLPFPFSHLLLSPPSSLPPSYIPSSPFSSLPPPFYIPFISPFCHLYPCKYWSSIVRTCGLDHYCSLQPLVVSLSLFLYLFATPLYLLSPSAPPLLCFFLYVLFYLLIFSLLLFNHIPTLLSSPFLCSPFLSSHLFSSLLLFYCILF